jgi:hypothetical protein
MEWTIDKSRLPSFIRVETRGEPQLKDLMDMWQEILESDFWKPGLNVLVDNRKLGQIKERDRFTLGAIEFFAAHRKILGTACIAAIRNEPTNDKYVRLFQYGVTLKGSDAVLEIFSSETEAITWLEHYCKAGETKDWAVAASDK